MREMAVSKPARRVATIVVIAMGVPIALFAGVNLSCTANGMSPSCAGDGLLLTPLLLLISGLIAAFLARGLIGFMLGAIGIAVGMLLLWIIAAFRGTFLPLDPAQAVLATIWFGLPSVAGYMLGRIGIWAFGKLTGRGPAAPPDHTAESMGEGI